MLSEFEQKQVWDGWLGAEIRAAYFAALGQRYLARQRWITIGSLVLASGAAASMVASVPEGLHWVRAALAILAAILSACSLVMKNERSAIDCGDLHFRWNSLAMQYEDLWGQTWADTAQERLQQLRTREADISKSSTALPEERSLLVKAQENVEMHHAGEAAYA